MKMLFISVITLLLITSGCKKADVSSRTSGNAASNAVSSNSTGWTSLSGWLVKNYDKSSVYTSIVTDSSVTAEVVEKGLVLVYKKNDTLITTLPFHQNVNGTSQFWFYQVTNGKILVSCNTSQTGKPGVDQSIVYFVIKPQQLTRLEQNGNTKAKLLNLSYRSANALLKQ